MVADAGPLIAPAGIGQLDLLRNLFGEVLVAEDVRDEVEAGGKSRTDANMFSTAPWIVIANSPIRVDPLLKSLLDRGEATTIALAIQTSASLVLIDEIKGRKIARNIYKLHVIGTGRVLVEAKHSGLISAVSPFLQRLRANGYWLSDRIVAEIVHQAGE